LSLLLKKTQLVRELHLYDVKGTAGVMADLSHINTLTKVRAFEGNQNLLDCLKVSGACSLPRSLVKKVSCPFQCSTSLYFSSLSLS